MAGRFLFQIIILAFIEIIVIFGSIGGIMLKQSYTKLLMLPLFFWIAISGADTIPGGDVSGTWYAANSPYYVTGNITIPASDTLIIEPGVLVDFLGGYSFTVNGVLAALGTASDSIHFFSEDTLAGWSRIICGEYCDSLQLSYCTVSYADCGIEAYPFLTNVPISHCRFSRNTRALEWYGITSLQIDDCTFRDNGSAEYGAAITIWLAYGPVQITGCLFENNAASTFGGAILISQWSDNDIIISDCVFIDNTAEDWGGAIAAYEMPNPASLIIENCTFAENTAYGMNYDEGGGAIWASNLPDFNISYCCFYDNWAYDGSAINLASTYGNCNLDLDHCTFWSQEIFGMGSSNTILDVSNCIFTGAEYAIANHSNITLTVSYSDFNNNDVDIEHPPSGFGVLDRVNYNGDSCDCYYDIFMDPMFVDTTARDLHLLLGSPCIDAGDPAFAYDPDGTITDMGCYWFNQIGVAERPITKYAEHGYTGATIFSGPLMLPQHKTYKIFDITGRQIHTLDPAPGIYFIGVDGEIRQKVIKVR
jgi:hypothetical protein